jgi:2-succinyl-6-hydroxy-2,4-cyclohexadiene-1-carboxylate synthase
MKPIEWHYQLSGSDNHPPLVFLHGFMGSQHDWNFACNYWKTDRQCLAVDLPGHGRTKIRDESFYRMEETATSLVKLLDELGLHQSHLVGYSMGGRLALYLAIHYPQKFSKIILESASPGLKTDLERRKRQESDDRLAATLLHEGMEKFIEKWYDQPLFQTLKSHTHFSLLFKERILNDPAGLALSLRWMGTGSQPSLWPQLKKIKMSIMLLVGEYDLKFRRIAEEMQKENSHFFVKVIDNSGHTVHFENRYRFLSEVDRFIKS